MAIVAIVGIVSIILLAATMPINSVAVVAQEADPPALIPSSTAQVNGMILRIDSALIIAGNIVTRDVVVEQVPAEGIAGFILNVGVDDLTIARPVLFETPDYGMKSLEQSGARLRLAIADLNGVIATSSADVILGTVHFLGVAPGVTRIVLTVERMDDLDGSNIPTSPTAGLLTVTDTRDLDADGLTEDFNGNGRFDFADIRRLFQLLLDQPSD
jgi:hypothetical protein